jgi:hypothetical protein
MTLAQIRRWFSFILGRTEMPTKSIGSRRRTSGGILSKKKDPIPHYDNGFQDYPYYTADDISKLMNKEELKLFGKWIYGQTCPVVRGDCCYYTEDVNRFTALVRKGIPTYFD